MQDVVIKAFKTEYCLHRALLLSSSEYFEKLFGSYPAGLSEPVRLGGGQLPGCKPLATASAGGGSKQQASSMSRGPLAPSSSSPPGAALASPALTAAAIMPPLPTPGSSSKAPPGGRNKPRKKAQKTNSSSDVASGVSCPQPTLDAGTQPAGQNLALLAPAAAVFELNFGDDVDKDGFDFLLEYLYFSPTLQLVESNVRSVLSTAQFFQVRTRPARTRQQEPIVF